MTCGNLFLQISRQYCYSVCGTFCFIWNVIFSFIIEKITTLCFVLYATKIDLFSLSILILFVLFCIPGTGVFYNSWKKFFFLHSWSNNQFSCGTLRKIFTMRAGDYEQMINYDWSDVSPLSFSKLKKKKKSSRSLFSFLPCGFLFDTKLNFAHTPFPEGLLRTSEKYYWYDFRSFVVLLCVSLKFEQFFKICWVFPDFKACSWNHFLLNKLLTTDNY